MPRPLDVCCATICVLDQVRANAAICTRYDLGSIVASSAVVSTGTNSLHASRLSRPAILPGSACSPEPPSMIRFTVIQRLQTLLSTSSSTQQMEHGQKSEVHTLQRTSWFGSDPCGHPLHAATADQSLCITEPSWDSSSSLVLVLVPPGVDVLVSTKGGHPLHTQLQRSSKHEVRTPCIVS